MSIDKNCATKLGQDWATVRSTKPITEGVHRWAVKASDFGVNYSPYPMMVGIVPDNFNNKMYTSPGGCSFTNEGNVFGCEKISGLAPFGVGDVILLELDMGNALIKVTARGQTAVARVPNLKGPVYPSISLYFPSARACFVNHPME